MTNLTDYDALVSVQSELDKLRKDYNGLALENLRMKELLKDCKKYLSLIKRNVSVGNLAYTYVEKAQAEIKELEK